MRIFVFSFLILSLLALPALAQEPTPRYILELEPYTASPSATLGSLDSTDAELFNEQGYIAHYSGEEYMQITANPSTLTLDELNTNHKDIKDSIITVFSTSGYQLSLQSLKPFTTTFGDEIPPTTCDGGANTCTTQSGAVWRKDTPGFGYHIAGPGILTRVHSAPLYQPFPTSPFTLTQNGTSETPDEFIMTVQAIKPADQAEGNYHTVIEVMTINTL